MSGYGDRVVEPDDRTLLANVGVRVALKAQELVDLLKRDDHAARRRARGACPRIERVAEGRTPRTALYSAHGRSKYAHYHEGGAIRASGSLDQRIRPRGQAERRVARAAARVRRVIAAVFLLRSWWAP